MSVRKTQFSRPSVPRSSRNVRTEIVEPVLGLNVSRSPQHLKPGETPKSQNFVVEDRYLRPRSGVSQYGSLSTVDTALFAGTVYEFGGTEHLHVLSTKSWYERTAADTAWAVSAFSSASTGNFYDAVSGYYTAGSPELYVTNNDAKPFVVSPDQSAGASPMADFCSLESVAKYVTAFDERLIFFNTTAATVNYGTRARWSVRGSTRSFQQIGAGFQDIVAMGGYGTGIVAERDRLVLTSNEEVWAARARRDVYAFDFYPLDQTKGCVYPRTLWATEAGTLWLGAGFQFYRLYGNEVRPLGDEITKILKDEVREGPLTWSVYNEDEHLYGLFYSDTTGQYPSKALFLRTDLILPKEENQTRDRGVWLQQDFGPLEFPVGTVFGGETTLVSSAGTPYRLRSTQTTDAGTAIDARWRTHLIDANQDGFQTEAINEVWIDFDNTAASTVSMFTSRDNGTTFTPAGQVTLGASSDLSTAFLPVTPIDGRHTQLELRVADGGRPRISKIQLKLAGKTGRYAP